MPAPGAPIDVRARATTCAPPRCKTVGATVELAWQPPSGGGSIDGYVVIRDGSEVTQAGEVGPGETSWVDESATPSLEYTYQVVTVGPGGRSDPSEDVRVKLPKPPLSAARFEGFFNVHLVVTRATFLGQLEGIEDPKPGDKKTDTWSFLATCRRGRGECPTEWGFGGTLRPRGTIYTGTFQGPSPSNCGGGDHAPEHITMRLRVTMAAMDGEWKVSRFEGDYTVSFACSSFASIGTFHVTGTALG